MQYIEQEALYDEDGAASTGSDKDKGKMAGESRGVAPESSSSAGS